MKSKKKYQVSEIKLLETSLKHQGKVFFEESTLHGVRYIAETGRPLFEKFMWFICVAIGAIATMVIIVSLWEKFQTTPTITGLDTDFHTWDVSFPAVTVCQDEPANITRLEARAETEYPDKVKEMTEFLAALSQLSYYNIKDFKKYTGLKLLPDNIDLKNFTFGLMNPCEDIFVDCSFKAEAFNCCDEFFPIFTENGFCYAFNSKHYDRRSEDTTQFNVKYIKETDAKWSLMFTALERFTSKVYIHDYQEVPGIDMNPQHKWNFMVDRIMFSMKQTYTTDDAHQLSIKQRHCIFANEVKLKIDDIYTYSGCTQQCRMDNAMKLCGCVPHFTRGHTHGSYTYCKIAQLACIVDHLKEIQKVDKCNCELGCSNTVYEVEKLSDNTDDNTFLETEFVSWPMVMYKREVLFGWVDLLVSFGGIAGLFLGFSLLSGVEIIYYFTIRAWCMVYQEKEELIKIIDEDKVKKKKDVDLSLVPYFIPKNENRGKDFLSKINRRERKVHASRNNNFNYYKDDFLSFPKRLEPIKVKPINAKQKIVVPPFGIEFMN